jgi:hypothetical protein
MAALEEEALQAVARSEEKATAIIRESQRRPKRPGHRGSGELVFVTCRRRDGGGGRFPPRESMTLPAGDRADVRVAGEDPLVGEL